MDVMFVQSLWNCQRLFHSLNHNLSIAILEFNGFERKLLSFMKSYLRHCKKMKFSIRDFFCKCDQMHRKLRIWSHLQKKSLMENFIFCPVRGKSSLQEYRKAQCLDLFYLTFISMIFFFLSQVLI